MPNRISLYKTISLLRQIWVLINPIQHWIVGHENGCFNLFSLTAVLFQNWDTYFWLFKDHSILLTFGSFKFNAFRVLLITLFISILHNWPASSDSLAIWLSCLNGDLSLYSSTELSTNPTLQNVPSSTLRRRWRRCPLRSSSSWKKREINISMYVS